MEVNLKILEGNAVICRVRIFVKFVVDQEEVFAIVYHYFTSNLDKNLHHLTLYLETKQKIRREKKSNNAIKLKFNSIVK